ncbi:MAG TPA: TrmH family RNA methyltransferase [Methyloceanibacter sp.]|nr:TrmH family RNA methyltransferase [Methyloceanibacter sp.]
MKSALPSPRGYFAIGIEGISKPINLGNLLRSAHAFGASFVFTIGADPRALEMRSDTSRAESHVPLYHWPSLAELALPRGCSLVGVEILDEAADLQSFPQPLPAIYVLGPERGALTPDLPPGASISCAFHRPFSSMLRPPEPLSCMTACALWRFGSRPVASGAEAEPPRPHVQGGPKRVRRD